MILQLHTLNPFNFLAILIIKSKCLIFLMAKSNYNIILILKTCQQKRNYTTVLRLIGCAIRVHTELIPGLLKPVNEKCLNQKLF